MVNLHNIVNNGGAKSAEFKIVIQIQIVIPDVLAIAEEQTNKYRLSLKVSPYMIHSADGPLRSARVL